MVSVFHDVRQHITIPLVEIRRDDRIPPFVRVRFVLTPQHGYTTVSFLRLIEKADIAIHRVREDYEAVERLLGESRFSASTMLQRAFNDLISS